MNNYNNILDEFFIQLKYSPKSTSLLYKIANIYYRMNCYDKSIDFCNQILKLDKQYYKAYTCLADNYKKLCDINKSILYYKKSIQINSKYSYSYNNLGIAYKIINKPNLALKNYLKANSLMKNNASTLHNIANIHFELQNFNKALFYIEKANNIEKNNPEILYQISTINLQQNNYEDGFYYYNYIYSLISIYASNSLGLLKKNDDIKNKTLYIYLEQGYGDMIQFIRFLPYFYNAGAKIYCNMHNALVKLFLLSYPYIEFIQNTQNIKINYHFPLMQSAYLLGLRYEKIPNSSKY